MLPSCVLVALPSHNQADAVLFVFLKPRLVMRRNSGPAPCATAAAASDRPEIASGPASCTTAAAASEIAANGSFKMLLRMTLSFFVAAVMLISVLSVLLTHQLLLDHENQSSLASSTQGRVHLTSNQHNILLRHGQHSSPLSFSLAGFHQKLPLAAANPMSRRTNAVVEAVSGNRAVTSNTSATHSHHKKAKKHHPHHATQIVPQTGRRISRQIADSGEYRHPKHGTIVVPAGSLHRGGGSGPGKVPIPLYNYSASSPIITNISYPVEDPLPNIDPPPDGYETFSGCMLLMDDNHRLAENLAYHYHVLPLRYLIVATDPRARTSPTFLLNQWRKKGMYIEEWTDVDFWRSDLQAMPDNAILQMKRDRHRGRQKFFYRRCLEYLLEQNRTWVTLHDSDEFLVYNHKGGAEFAAWEQSRIQHDKLIHHGLSRRIKPSMTPPTTAEEGAMIQYIRHEQEAGLAYYQSPCIGLPRLTFGAEESTPEQVAKSVPKKDGDQLVVDPAQLDTLRYRKHAFRNDFNKNSLGKVLIDVSRVDVHNAPYFMSLHRPIRSICKAPWHNDWDSGLRLNHYLGSWESYSIRDDARRGNERSYEQWEFKAYSNGEHDDDNIRPWLSGFVDRHGHEEAAALLAHAGVPPDYEAPTAESWRLMPEKLHAILRTNVTESNDHRVVLFEAYIREKYRNYTVPPEDGEEEAADETDDEQAAATAAER
jgi:hypothetical protein